MALRRVAIILLIVLTTTLSAAEELGLPSAPEGYTWQRCPAAKGALLQPDGWHFAAADSTPNAVYYITKEPLDSRHVATSLTLTVVPDPPETRAMEPADYVNAFVRHMSRRLGIVKDWTADFGNLASRGQVTNDRPDLVLAKRRWTYVFANRTTGTLLIYLFETPTADWEENWAVIEPVVGKLMLDDSV